MLANASQSIVRFGPYEADFANGELRKHGVRIRVQAKPFTVLKLLVESKGQIVSREELQQALWPDGVFVDFEKNLSTAVNKLRVVLSDSAETPRYVETIPQRGYRFLAPVEIPAGFNQTPQAPPVPQPTVEQSVQEAPLPVSLTK